jgi:hypothetical protein
VWLNVGNVGLAAVVFTSSEAGIAVCFSCCNLCHFLCPMSAAYAVCIALASARQQVSFHKRSPLSACAAVGLARYDEG